jgi:glutaminyl-peptide cyclotransferase
VPKLVNGMCGRLSSKFWLASAIAVLSGVVACGASNAPSSASSASSSSAAPAAGASPVDQSAAPPKLTEVAPPADQTGGFDGAKAYEHVAKLVSFGPRPPASEALHHSQDYIIAQLKAAGCDVNQDDFHAATPKGDVAMKNIIGKAPGTGQGIILLLTHYDTLSSVENFVGAEDSASSTGMMLEMARQLCGKKGPNSVWMAFLDGEEAFVNWDQDNDHTYGSRELAARMAVSGDLKRVKAVLLADMIGQYNLKILRQSDSPKWLNDLVWKKAAQLGYNDIFVSDETTTSDDHDPFLARGVPALDIIDLNDYITAGYWHTPQDTMDKVSPRSVAIVGYVILESADELQKKFH